MNIYHRYFVQYMIENGVSTVDNALKFCKDVSKGKIENIIHLKTLIIELNRNISKQFYKIVINTCEVTNQDVVVWLNTKNDEISKQQITYSALELEYFHVILQQILGSEEHRITFIVCINITSTLTASFSRDSGQKVLNIWLRGGYFIKRGDFIYLGSRTILEFTSYLRAHCPNCICNLCSELVFTGRQCSHCYKTLHSYCIAKYLRNQAECPCCKNPWVDLNEEEPHNDTTSQDIDADEFYATSQDQMALPSTSQEPESSVIRRSNRRNQRQEESEQDDEESETSGPSGRKRHKSYL